MGDDDDVEQPPELGSLTVLWGDAEGDAPVQSRKLERPSYCPHMSVELDHEARRVHCRQCKSEVDAFTFLAMLAREWERYAGWAESHRRDAKQAAAALAEVKRQLSNAKAQLRRASKKAAPVAPGSVEDVVLRWLAGWRAGRTADLPRGLRWLLEASDPAVEAAGDWRVVSAREREENERRAELHVLDGIPRR